MLLLRFATVLLVVTATSGCSTPVEREGPRPPVDAFTATVERVVDGDTLIAQPGNGRRGIRVRLIGIDAPEAAKPGAPAACHSAEATAYLTSRLRGRRVRASHEGARHQDRFGRDLWHVWLMDGTFVSGEAAALGHVRTLRVPPHVRHAAYLSERAASAKAARAGLWGSCPNVPGRQ